MRTRGAVLGFAALLLLAGCGGSPKASPTPAPGTPTTSAASGPPSTAPVSPTVPTLSSTRAPGSTVTVGSIMSVQVPAGWVATPSAVVGGTGTVCLSPRSGGRDFFGCGEIEIDYGSRLPGAENSNYAPDESNGWYHATDVSQCPFVPQSGKFVPLKTENGFDKGIRAVGSHHADWNRWTASCAGRTFHPQAWYLPKSKVVIFDYFGHSETASVLGSALFASDGAVLAKYLSGHLVSATASKIVVQPFHTYTTGAAGKAYAAAHGLEYPFPNDYYDADEGAKVTFLMNAATSCTGNVNLGKTPEGAPVPCSAFTKLAAKHLSAPMGIWLLPGGSTAQTVIEIFRP
ncbi:MAG: hypothetical protein ACJ72O_15810 [Marmoricola sp.]